MNHRHYKSKNLVSIRNHFLVPLKITLLACISLSLYSAKAQIDPNTLLGIPKATSAEIIAITGAIGGSLVYDTDLNTIFEYNGSGWIEHLTGKSAWKIKGNTATSPGVDFVGTTDAQDLILKTNNAERLRILQSGEIGINTNSPNAQLDIESTGVPLRITPSATTPTGTLNGQLFIGDDGLLYAYDNTRSKWLSVDRKFVGWGRNSVASNEYLRQFNGPPSNLNGWHMIRNGTISAISVQTDTASTFIIEIRKNDAVTVITSLNITSSEGGHNNTINVDFAEGDFLQCYLNGTEIEYPEVLIEIAWRK